MRVAMIAYTPYEMDARVKRAAEALVERGHQVDVFAASQEGVPPAADTSLLRIHRLPMRKQRTAVTRYAFEYGSFFAWAFILVSFFHLRRVYRVVYVHNMPNFLVFAGLIPRLTGAKIILDVHDPASELLACIRGRELPRWLRVMVTAEERVSMSFADAVITVNESMRQRLTTISRRPVAVVMNLPDPSVFGLRETSGWHETSGLGGAGQWLVYSGTIARRNGLDLVVRALSLLTADFPALRFRIIGEGPAVESVRRQAEREGVADRVEFRSFVAHHEIPAAVGSAVAGISAQQEDAFGSLVFSVKVAEYAALGLPVICSRTATMQHYFGDDEMFFFEPASTQDMARAIRDLLTDPAAAQQRAVKAQLKLDKLSWSAQKQTLVETVEELADSRGSQSRNELELAGIPWPERSAHGGAQSRRTP
jgi:glycosyltransferase involved in cell wall biosynthesis